MELELREIFVTYVELMRRAASESYNADLLIWAVLAAAGAKGIKKPEPPAVLRAPKIVIGG